MNPKLSSPESVGFSSQRLERIKPAMQSFVDGGKFPGFVTLLARRGKVIHFEQVGWLERESKTPMAGDTIFRIYSMTKPIICTALMLLYEEGRFRLLDPLAKYLPAFASVKVYNGKHKSVDPIRPILIRDLFTHTSGLTYDFLEDSPVAEMYRQARLGNDASRSLEAVIAELAQMPLAYQPGSKWHYSISIDVLAHLIEVISGQSLQVFLNDRLFAPLEMEDTGFYVPPKKHKRLVTMTGLPDIVGKGVTFHKQFALWNQGYHETIDVSDTYPAASKVGFARGGHGLFSTAPDYLRFAQMLLNGGELDGQRFLSRKTLELMHTNHVPAALLPYEIGGFPSLGYGFGLGSRVLMDVGASAMPGSVGEYGWAGAAKTYYWIDPQEEIVGISMSQSMMAFDQPEVTFRQLAYQALID